MTEDEIAELARTMGRGGCDNRLIAMAVSQCARTTAESRFHLASDIQAERLRIVELVRQHGWFE